MKQGKPLITFLIASMAVALAIYLGVYAFQAFYDPYTTTLVYAYTTHDSVELDGILAREEQVLPGQAGILEVTRAEGERVGVGQEVARFYRDTQAQADQAQLQALDLEIELLQYAAVQSGDLESAARLDEDILQSIVDLRASSALGDYTQLEDQVLELKSGVLKRGYTYGDGLTAQQLSEQLSALTSQRAALNQQSAAATTQVTAPQSGVFSTLVDGFESVLTPDSVLQLTPSSLRTLLDTPAVQDSSAAGKLITSQRWWYAANLPAGEAERLNQGDTVTLRFTGDFSQDVEMRVDQVGPTEGQQTLVVCSTDRYLSQTTLLRRQTAELIFESWSGLRIPKSALHLVEETVEDEETGESSVVTRLGVYALVAGRTEFKEVEVIMEGADYYVVNPLGSSRKLLRAGDEIITEAVGLQDGLLLEF